MISIIGAGPVGNYAAYLLAKNGYEVNVYEEHLKIGQPIQCTGIVTSSLNKIVRSESFVINKIKKTRIYAPNNEFLELKLEPNIIIDRTKFDLFFSKKAKTYGATFHLGHRFIDHKNNIIKLKHKDKIRNVHTDILIGADGPQSQVAKSSGFFKRVFFVGVQARAYFDNENVVEFFPGIGDFAWIVPESKKIVRIGLVARDKPNVHFKNFLIKIFGKNYKNKIIELQGGLIPMYYPKVKTAFKNVFLVGDAAAMVKATTAGGIVQGLIGAEALSDSIVNDLDYEKEWRKRIGRDLHLSLMIRRIMDQFSNEDYNKLIGILNHGSKKVLEKHNRDSMTKLLPSLCLEMIKQPKSLYFLRFLLNQNIYK